MQQFLANRKSKGQEEEDSSPSVDTPRKDVIFHKRIYGSDVALDGEEQTEDRNRRFKIETCSDHQVGIILHKNLLSHLAVMLQDMMDIPSMPVLENPENQTKW